MTDRTYCTLAEVLNDLNLPGVRSEAQLVSFIRAASAVIDKRGKFTPVLETRYYDGSEAWDLYVAEVLTITGLTLADGDQTYNLTSNDYVPYPRARWWPNGPYTRLEVNADSLQISGWIGGQSNVALTGLHGLYLESRNTGATVGSQNDSSTDLVVSNGAAISPGAVLLIESEQELVEGTGVPTDSTANTAEALDNSEEEVDVNDASLVNVGEIIRVEFEQMKVLDKLSNTLLVERGWNGTRKVTHTTGLDVYVYRTFTVKRGVNGTTAASHTSAAISRYAPPADVNYLCRQMAGLMHKKAGSGWAGRVGNAESGETFYFNEFPNDPLKKIMEGYTTLVAG